MTRRTPNERSLSSITTRSDDQTCGLVDAGMTLPPSNCRIRESKGLLTEQDRS